MRKCELFFILINKYYLKYLYFIKTMDVSCLQHNIIPFSLGNKQTKKTYLSHSLAYRSCTKYHILVPKIYMHEKIATDYV